MRLTSTKILLATIALNLTGVLLLSGCSVDTGDNYDQSNQDHSYSYVFTEGDRTYGTGTYLFCNDANCSVTNSNNVDDNSTEPTEPDAQVGVYSANYNQVECVSAGFFWCNISELCLNQRVDDSSSTCGK